MKFEKMAQFLNIWINGCGAPRRGRGQIETACARKRGAGATEGAAVPCRRRNVWGLVWETRDDRGSGGSMPQKECMGISMGEQGRLHLIIVLTVMAWLMSMTDGY